MKKKTLKQLCTEKQLPLANRVRWKKRGFYLAPRSFFPHREENREVLAQVFHQLPFPKEKVRKVWDEEARGKIPSDLPAIIGEDGFVRMYAMGAPLSLSLLRRIWYRLSESPPPGEKPLLTFVWNPDTKFYYDVKSVPTGLLPKFFPSQRMKQEEKLLSQVQSDLWYAAKIEDPARRRSVTLATLSQGVAYRELDERVLEIPSLVAKESSYPVLYYCRQHLIDEGVKTICLFPLQGEKKEPGIYLCQGTEVWPSQPLMLDSIVANFGKEGSAAVPYARSWRLIHKHLKELTGKGGPLPIVAGHSMGGALATQMVLYAHTLISHAHASNPPVVEQRDFAIYHTLSPEVQQKLHIYANIDDLPFWRIGSRVIGQVTILLAKKRWKYYPFRLLDFIFVLPALWKAIINLVHAAPSHQNVPFFQEHCLLMPLSQQEMERENKDRAARFDRFHFITRIEIPTRRFIRFLRRLLKKPFQAPYLKSQIELITLHETELKEMLAQSPNPDHEKELEELSRQKKILKRHFTRVSKSRRRTL